MGRASGGNEILNDSRYDGFQLLDEVHAGDDNDDQGEFNRLLTDPLCSLCALISVTFILSINVIFHFPSSDGQDSEEDYDSEVPEEEIDALLEEGLPEEMKGPRKRRREALLGEGEEAPYDERQKIVLVGEEEMTREEVVEEEE